MNQEHILDPVRAQLDAGMTSLVLGDQPDSGGLSMKTLGWGMLAVVLIVAAFSARSLLELREWDQRSQSLTTRAVLLKIAPHILVPAVILWFAYRYLGPVVLGQPAAWNFRYVGAYFLPEVAILLGLAVVPDLIQAGYMSWTVARQRLRRRRRPATTEQPEATRSPVGATSR